MKQHYRKSYNELLDKIKRNTYNIKKEDYQYFLKKTKDKTLESFLFFSDALFQNRKSVKVTELLWRANQISYKKFKQIRLDNFYNDLYFSLAPYYSTFMIWRVEEALQVAYHTKGSYQDKALAAFEYLEKK